ncbi:hypothetical protein QYM36_018659 [Artemia franciscana]|uniref:Uncharacterized protein n=1 Tax=Artemia franciscana TaxID=6661 RepID=A0AA88H6G2_ARTSF|nr:hypothetical protein QYM36_018659 [Artemia franciscana]
MHCKMGFRFTKAFLVNRQELRKIAARLAELAGTDIKSKFCKGGILSDTWTTRFINQHHELSIRAVKIVHWGRSAVTKEKLKEQMLAQEPALKEDGVQRNIEDFETSHLWLNNDEAIIHFNEEALAKKIHC